MKLSTIPAKLWFGGAVALAAAVAAAQLDSRFVAAQEAADRAGGLPAAPAPLDGTASVAADTLKDMETMRRVLVREALGARPSDARIALYGTAGQTAYSGTVAPADAIFVPGHGATFILRTSDPVAPPPGSGRSATPAQRSVWEEEAAALDRPTTAGVWASHEGRALWNDGVRVLTAGTFSTYDALKVGALRDRVLEQLATYGSRIRGLGATERVSVVVIGGPAGITLPVETVVNPAPDTTGAVPPASAADPVTRRGQRAIGGTIMVASVGGGTTLTISVSVADCDAAAKGTLSRDEFRRRAVVSQY